MEMVQQKPPNSAVLNWVFGMATTVCTGSFLFAWNTNIKITVLLEHDREKTETISTLQQSINNMQLNTYDIKSRLTNLESKQTVKTN